MMRYLCLAVSLANALYSSALAQQQPTSTKPEDPIVVTGERKEEQKQVCKRVTETGSIITKRVCRSKRESEEQRERGIAALERMKDLQDTEAHIRELRRSSGGN